MVTKTHRNKILISERKVRGLKQSEFAELIGISQSLLSQLESGTKEPSYLLAKRIAAILNVSIGEVFKKYR